MLPEIVESQPDPGAHDPRELIATTDPDELTQAALGQGSGRRAIWKMHVACLFKAEELRQSAAEIIIPWEQNGETERPDSTELASFQTEIGNALITDGVTPTAPELEALFGSSPASDPAVIERSEASEAALTEAARYEAAAQKFYADLSDPEGYDVLAAKVLYEQNNLSRRARIGRKVVASFGGATILGVPAHELLRPALENSDRLVGDRPTIAAVALGAMSAWKLTSSVVDTHRYKGRHAQRRAQKLEAKKPKQ